MGFIIPINILNNVVLPDPFGPNKHIVELSYGICKFIYASPILT